MLRFVGEGSPWPGAVTFMGCIGALPIRADVTRRRACYSTVTGC